jgi:GGDEF domain-containing protein
MTSKQKIITTGIILLIITLMTYLFFRVGLIEKNHVQSIKKSSEQIFNTIRAFNGRNDGKANRSVELEKTISIINKKTKNLSLLVIGNLDFKIEISSRNNRSIETDLYEKILHEFVNGKIKIPDNSEYLVRYYGSGSREKANEDRFYIFDKIIDKSRVLLAYKYMVDQKTIVKIIVESGLIILFYIIISSLVFIISLKSKNLTLSEDYADLSESLDSFEIDPEKKETLVNKTKETASSSTKNAALDAMNTYIYTLFAKISKMLQPESLALFTRLSDNHFTKSHELKKNSFKVIESRTFETFNLNDDIYRELKKDRIMIMDSGKKSIIPVIHDNSLLGFIQFGRKESLKKDEINDIRKELGAVAGHISEYLVINNIMIDNRTGVFSETYFRLKYNELLQLYRRSDTVFSILLISLFHKRSNPDKNDRLSIIKTLAPAINEVLPAESFTCLYDDYLAILLPGADEAICEDLAEEIKEELKKFRIKMKNGETLRSEPEITFSSTHQDKNNPVDFALRSMENIIFSEENRYMQTSLI